MKIHRAFFLLILSLGVPMAFLTASNNKIDVADASRDPVKYISDRRENLMSKVEWVAPLCDIKISV